jgi:ABC-2 type transport system permease protein
MRQFKTIFKFEYLNYVKSKSYIVMSCILIAIILIGGSIPAFKTLFDRFGSDAPDDAAELEAAAIYDAGGLYTDDVLRAYFPGYTWARLASPDGIEAEIGADVYAFAVEIDGLAYTAYEKSEGFSTASAPLFEMIRAVYQASALADAGLAEGEIGAILGAVPAGETVLVGKDFSQSFWLAYALLFMLYITIMLYGQYVLTSVVTEKSSKAMELLVTSAKPLQLMFGKVFGTGCAGLTQFGVLILCAVAALRLNLAGWTALSPMVSSVITASLSGGLFAYAIIFFLLGFFMFAFLYAAVGSTVTRMEEANSVVVLPMFLFIAAFLVAMTGLPQPGALYVRVCSFVPFLSPLVMFMRICMTEVPFWESALAIALNVAYVLATGWAGAKVYRVGVMLYGNAPKLKDILRYVRQA